MEPGKTPRGQFSFTYAFGILPNPGTELSYTQVDDTYYWVDDVNSRYYNQFVTTKTTPKAWNFPADAFLFLEDQMITILKNVQPGCQIIIDSASELKNY